MNELHKKLVAAALIVAITGCSIVPRAMPQPALDSPPSVLRDSDTPPPTEDAETTGAGAMTKGQKLALMAALVILLGVLAYAASRSVSRSFADGCCYP